MLPPPISKIRSGPAPNTNLLSVLLQAFEQLSIALLPQSPATGTAGDSSAECPPWTVISTWSYSTVKLEWLK